MAGSGPPPKENRRRRNVDTYGDVQAAVSDDGSVRGPELTGDWSEQTVTWYEMWRRAPQAQAFLATDWMRLQMLASVVEAFFQTPDTKLLSEIRLNESLLGATHVDRLKGRIKVEAPTPASTEGAVTAIDEYRKRLGAG